MLRLFSQGAFAIKTSYQKIKNPGANNPALSTASTIGPSSPPLSRSHAHGRWKRPQCPGGAGSGNAPRLTRGWRGVLAQVSGRAWGFAQSVQLHYGAEPLLKPLRSDRKIPSLPF